MKVWKMPLHRYVMPSDEILLRLSVPSVFFVV